MGMLDLAFGPPALGTLCRYRDHTCRVTSTDLNGEVRWLWKRPDKPQCSEYPVVRYTPKGAWIWTTSYDRGGRFVLLECGRPFAHRTKKKALEAYIRRKRAHIRHAAASLRGAEASLEFALDMRDGAASEDFYRDLGQTYQTEEPDQ